MSIKDVRSQGGLYSSDIFRTRRSGFFHVQTSTLFGAKNFGFFKIYGVSVQTRGERVEPVRRFCEQGKGVNFLRFSADVFL